MVNRKVLFLTTAVLILVLSVWFYIHTASGVDSDSYTPPSDPPQVSGWIAWWKEDAGISLLDNHPGQINSISPFCYTLSEDGSVNVRCNQLINPDLIKKYKDLGVEVIPSLGSEVPGEKLSVLVRDEKLAKEVSERLVMELLSVQADGVDIDLEGITEESKDDFTLFIAVMSETFRQYGLKFVVTVQAKTGVNDPAVTKGQDLAKIAELADEVRVMAYDKHGTFSGPGAISPNDWLSDVVKYNLQVIPKEKLVIGLPSYGYIWETNGNSEGYQYDDFNRFINESSNNPSVKRDPLSGELIYTADNYTGWISDSQSLISKMQIVRSFGINRFAIWNLGGMDERFFDFDWQTSD